MLRALVPYLAYLYISLVGLTTRLKIRGQEHRAALRSHGQRFIYAFWHQRQVFFTYSHRHEAVSVLVSRSRDGEMIARTMKLSGIDSSRGSSTRGGMAAARELVDAVAAGLDIGITPDGPKGPARQVKPGVLFLAQKLGIPILPLTNALSHRLQFNSWDRFQVPLPFGRAALVYGEPIWIKAGDDLQAKAEELRAALDEITLEADREVGRA